MQCFYLPIISKEKNRIRVIPSQYIVDGYGPKAMGKLLYFVVPFNIQPNIEPIVIRDPKLISIAEENKFRVIEIE